ncbi:hypothetical protein HNQ50_002740 [Silvimonas terrae]|uniref:Uncharacterized protein n=1 Tax=Silvimonas terrae TaxID=300266 RepID=A0A840RID1_9NEIS|nr:hypothetical protein [Silvimonas terrae]MBB5192003.1 hypothetical protein [Silvimonas terrae]
MRIGQCARWQAELAVTSGSRAGFDLAQISVEMIGVMAVAYG